VSADPDASPGAVRLLVGGGGAVVGCNLPVVDQCRQILSEQPLFTVVNIDETQSDS
jgi:hypothetical protein